MYNNSNNSYNEINGILGTVSGNLQNRGLKITYGDTEYVVSGRFIMEEGDDPALFLIIYLFNILDLGIQ